MSFFGILTTPLFCSSRTSIILFFFLKSMVSGGKGSIKRFVGMFKYCLGNQGFLRLHLPLS
jgi:hypothetical protein